MLKHADLPRSTYYYHAKEKQDKYAKLKEEIERIFVENEGRYGYRRILSVLRENNIKINHKTVQKLMKELSLQGKQRRSKYRSYRGEFGRVAPNVLNRNFKTERPYEKLVTDVTEFAVCDEKIYLSPVMDLYNKEILSYSVSRSPSFAQTREMLTGLFEILPQDATPLLHSDQGWQYQMPQYHKALKDHEIIQSMSRKGNCLDNSPMENFFGKMKNEMFYGHEYEFETLEQLQKAMDNYIDYYNNKRIQVKLKGLTPCQARNQSLYSA